MAVELTGTPVAWTSGDITVPDDATAVYMFYAGWGSSLTLSSATLETVAADAIHKLAASGDASATGVAVWYNPTTGSNRTPALTWSTTVGEGPVVIWAFVKGGDTSAWRDVDSAHNTSTTAVSVTIDSNSTDLVLKFDQRYGHDDSTYPATSSGWTSRQTLANNKEYSRLSSCNSPGASTTVCDSETEYYSTIVAVSIPAASGAGASVVPVIMRQFQMRRR